MSNADFKPAIDFIERNLQTLVDKNIEYGVTGIFHNFEVGAKMLNTSRHEALAGMMVKHTTSVYDMIRDPRAHSIPKWEEKIGDHINYLLLLYLMVLDDEREPNTGYSENRKV